MRMGWLRGHFGATEKKTAEARRGSFPLNNHRRLNQVLMTGPKQRLSVLLTASVSAALRLRSVTGGAFCWCVLRTASGARRDQSLRLYLR